ISINEGWIWTHAPQAWQTSSGWLIVTPALDTNFWAGVDTGQFLYQTISGNFTVETRISTILTTNYQQAGLMIRQDENNWSKTTFEYSDGLAVKTGVNRNGTATVGKSTSLPSGTGQVWLRVVRNGGTFIASYSLDGSTWIQHYSWSQSLQSTLMVGLCVTDANSGVAFQPSFDYFRYSNNNLVPYIFTTETGGTTYTVFALSNSAASGFSFNQSTKMISLNVAGISDTNGLCNLTMPKALLGPPYSLQIDVSSTTPTITSNSTHVSLYFIYPQGAHSITIAGTMRDTTSPTIGNIRLQPSSPTPNDTTSITGSVTDTESGVKEINLYYSTSGGASWNKISMSNVGGSDYTGTIPQQVNGTIVQYYVQALDNDSNQAETTITSFTVRQIPDIMPPVLSYLRSQPSSPTSNDDVSITVSVADDKSGVKQVDLYYSTNGGMSWVKVSMSNIGGTDYKGTVPKQAAGSTIRFYVEALDMASNQVKMATSSYTVGQSGSAQSLDLVSLATIVVVVVVMIAIIAYMLGRRRTAESRVSPSDFTSAPSSQVELQRQVVVRCPRCGNEATLEATYCPICGASLQPAPPSPNPVPITTTSEVKTDRVRFSSPQTPAFATPDVKYCQQCGAPNDVGVSYCQSCGVIDFGPTAPSRIQRPLGITIIGIIQIIGSLLVLVFGLTFISSGSLGLLMSMMALLPLIFAIALFTGHNWARILMLIGAVLDIISITGIVWGVILLWYLTRPRVVAYFKQPK
ncbi:DUF1349 domain-containing protein, partial [Candidatus Bathyarchaeota archaeon]|nr:DUF1349 domain-containing protein [Candidatus Bathyarchaeota archaeon]